MRTTTPTIHPTPEQLQRVAASEDDGPVIMINLLRFKEQADGIHDGAGITGAEAYGRYGVEAQKHLARIGGRILLSARANESVIGPEDGEWDLVIAVEYPSRSAFLRMTSDPDYLEAHKHRTAAVADSRLIATSQLQV